MVYKRKTERQKESKRQTEEETERERERIPRTIFRQTTTRCNSTRNMTIKVLRTVPLGVFTEPLLADSVNDNVGFQISSKRVLSVLNLDRAGLKINK